MDLIQNRLKQLRCCLGLSQMKFGERIGYKYTAVGLWENGRRSISDAAVLLICAKFHVSETWLRCGTGDMFSESPKSALDALSEQYALDTLDRQIIRLYTELPSEKREVIKSLLYRLAADIPRTPSLEMAEDFSVDREIEAYRRELLLEKRGTDISSALPNTNEA